MTIISLMNRTLVPGSQDFIRLVPSLPLSHGSIYSTKPNDVREWVVEMAFRIHGPQVSGLDTGGGTGTGTGGKSRSSKGGRGLAFWYTKVCCGFVSIAQSFETDCPGGGH